MYTGKDILIRKSILTYPSTFKSALKNKILAFLFSKIVIILPRFYGHKNSAKYKCHNFKLKIPFI